MKFDYDYLVTLARKKYDEGDLEGAINLYEEAFKEKIDLKDYLLLGYIYIDTDHLTKALEVFDKISTYSSTFEIKFAYANIYEKMGKRDLAINLYKQTIALSPDFSLAYFNLAYLYDEIAEDNEESYQGENVQNAIKNYSDCLKLDDNNFWAHINLGSIYERFDYNSLALIHFEKAYKIDKDEKMVCYNMGVVLSKLKDYDQAKKYYLEELNKKEPFISTYYNLALVYKDGYKDYDKAQYYYLLGLSKNKEDYNIWYNLGCIHALKNDYNNAFECFKYIYYKNKKYLNLLKTDPELEGFRKTNYYNLLINGLE